MNTYKRIIEYISIHEVLHLPSCLFPSQVPTGSAGGGGSSAGGDGCSTNLWGEEESDLIRSCAALSSALGVHKSFSTSDISGVGATSTEGDLNRTWVSEVSSTALKELRSLDTFFCVCDLDWLVAWLGRIQPISGQNVEGKCLVRCYVVDGQVIRNS